MMSKKKNSIIALIAAIALIGAGIAGYYLTRTRYEKYTESMLDVFDTVITLVAYTKDEAEFIKYFDYAYDRLHELHKLYDFYNSYEGINNIVTINENAGISPVAVDKQIIDMILFAKDYYSRTGGKTNIAMGSVLSIWHRYRDDGINDPDNAKLPDMQELVAASLHTDINNVIVDESNGTVYLSDPLMSLDVGAVAKGYATELVADELVAMGMSSGMLNSGGNVKSVGKPMDGIRQRWGVGVQDPDAFIFSDDEDLLDVIFVNDAAVASSGDYQRYYEVDGKVLHHLIDPATLMPAQYFRAVTVLTDDAGLADFMSTALFMLPLEESRALAESFDNVEAFWVLPDGKMDATNGMLKLLRSQGASGADKQ